MKSVVLVIVFLAGLAFAGVASSNDPPGRDPCSHGATGKPCRPDPSTNGKDCDHHGKGGANEDHCVSTSTSSSTTTTARTTTAQTTTSSTTTGGSTSPTTSSTSTATSTLTATSSTPIPVTVPTTTGGSSSTTATLPKPDKKPVVKKPVKPATHKRVTHKRVAHELPYTGLSLRWYLLFAALLIAGGLAVKRWGPS